MTQQGTHQYAQPRQRPGGRALSEPEKRAPYVRRSSTEPRSSSEEPERQPRKGDKNWTGSPDHEKVRWQCNYSRESEVPAPQNEKALRAELQPLKAETDNPWPSFGEDSMLRVSGVAGSNVLTAMPKNRSIDLTPRRGVRQRF